MLVTSGTSLYTYLQVIYKHAYLHSTSNYTKADRTIHCRKQKILIKKAGTLSYLSTAKIRSCPCFSWNRVHFLLCIYYSVVHYHYYNLLYFNYILNSTCMFYLILILLYPAGKGAEWTSSCVVLSHHLTLKPQLKWNIKEFKQSKHRYTYKTNQSIDTLTKQTKSTSGQLVLRRGGWLQASHNSQVLAGCWH